MAQKEQESLELRMGSGGSGSGGQSFETIKFSFMPESISGKPGRLWKASEGGKSGEQKVCAEFDGGEGQAPVRYSGSVQKKENINDCVIVIKGGRATLHKLSGINILNKTSGSTDSNFPTTRPPALPEGLKRKYKVADDGGGGQSQGKRPAHASRPIPSSDDESSDDSDSSDGEAITSRVAASVPLATGGGAGGGKGLLSLGTASGSGGGKGLMVGGGKGLMGSGPPAEKPSSDDDESDDDESDEDSD